MKLPSHHRPFGAEAYRDGASGAEIGRGGRLDHQGDESCADDEVFTSVGEPLSSPMHRDLR